MGYTYHMQRVQRLKTQGDVGISLFSATHFINNQSSVVRVRERKEAGKLLKVMEHL